MRIAPVMIFVAAACAVPAPLDAASIVLVDQGGLKGSAAEAVFQIAADYWGSILTNDVEIRIGVEIRPLGRQLGISSNTLMDYAVTDWVDGVTATKSGSVLDQTIVMPELVDGGATFVTTGTDAAGGSDSGVYRLVEGSTESSKTLYTNTAVVKAVGGEASYSNANVDKVDGSIAFNSDAAFDYDPTDGTTAGSYDFLTIAIHELGHALGFSSGLDTLDAGSAPKGESGGTDWNDSSLYTALDMFRYSNDPNDVVAGEGAVLDLSVGTETYFSVDGGKTAVADNRFATGVHNGDGDEASHWQDTEGCTEIGLMSPTACSGSADVVAAVDLAAMDAIGWNLDESVRDDTSYRMTSADIYRAFVTVVPEPAGWATMLAGFAIMAGVLRRRVRRHRDRLDREGHALAA